MAEQRSLDIDDQYHQLVAGLQDLGFEAQDGIPALAQVHMAITPASVDLLNERVAAGHVYDELVIAPSIGRIGLIGNPEEPGFTLRFDEKQSHEPIDMAQFGFPYRTGDTKTAKTEVSEEVWAAFDDKDPLHDNYHDEDWQLGIMLNDKLDETTLAALESSPGNHHSTEAGLVYRGLNAESQRVALKKEAARLAERGHVIEPITVGQIIAINASRRAVGRLMLDAASTSPDLRNKNGAVRLVQYPDVKDSRYDYMISPGIWFNENWGGNHLMLGNPPANRRSIELGVRRILKLPLSADS